MNQKFRMVNTRVVRRYLRNMEMKEEVIQKAMEKVFLMVTLSDQESIIIKSQ